jgi:hypothetical protein
MNVCCLGHSVCGNLLRQLELTNAASKPSFKSGSFHTTQGLRKSHVTCACMRRVINIITLFIFKERILYKLLKLWVKFQSWKMLQLLLVSVHALDFMLDSMPRLKEEVWTNVISLSVCSHISFGFGFNTERL